MPTSTVYLISDALPVIIVIAVSALITAAIAAWLVHDVARKAIEKTTPEGVAQVVHALSHLLHPLRLYLPWSSNRWSSNAPAVPSGATPKFQHNGTSPHSSEENEHEA